MRFLLASVYPKLLWLALAAWAGALPFALARLRRRVSPGAGLALAAVLLGALAVRLSYAPAHRVYYDEFEHLDIARHLSSSGTFATTLAGGVGDFDVLGRPTWPGGHHAGLAAAFLLFGAGAGTAFAWSAFLSALSALFVFWAALELFDDERGALSAAFTWALLPLLVQYGRAADLTSSSVFWIAAALAALHSGSRVFAGITLALAVQVRPENVLLIGYAALAGADRFVIAPALIGLVFPAGIALANRAEALPGYSAASVAPLSHLARHFVPNLRFFASRAEFWPLLLPAAFAAATRLRAARLAALAAAFLVLYGGFFRGRFDQGTEDRYALSVILPLAIAAPAALGAAAVPVALLSIGLSRRPLPAPDAEHEKARAFLASSAPLIPEKAFVVAFNPAFVREVSGRPAVWAYLPLGETPATEFVLYKDWAWRSRPEDSSRLEKGGETKVLAENGTDSLVLFSPALRGRR